MKREPHTQLENESKKTNNYDKKPLVSCFGVNIINEGQLREKIKILLFSFFFGLAEISIYRWIDT